MNKSNKLDKSQKNKNQQTSNQISHQSYQKSVNKTNLEQSKHSIQNEPINNKFLNTDDFTKLDPLMGKYNLDK